MAVRYSGFLSVPQKEVAVVPATSFDLQESYHFGWQARVEIAVETDNPIPAGSILSAAVAKGIIPGRQVILQLAALAEDSEDHLGVVVRSWPSVVQEMQPWRSEQSTRKIICGIMLADPITHLSNRPIWGAYRATSLAEIVGGALSLAAGGDGQPTTTPYMPQLLPMVIVDSVRSELHDIPYVVAAGETLGAWLLDLLGRLGVCMELWGTPTGGIRIMLKDSSYGVDQIAMRVIPEVPDSTDDPNDQSLANPQSQISALQGFVSSIQATSGEIVRGGLLDDPVQGAFRRFGNPFGSVGMVTSGPQISFEEADRRFRNGVDHALSNMLKIQMASRQPGFQPGRRVTLNRAILGLTDWQVSFAYHRLRGNSYSNVGLLARADTPWRPPMPAMRSPVLVPGLVHGGDDKLLHEPVERDRLGRIPVSFPFLPTPLVSELKMIAEFDTTGDGKIRLDDFSEEEVERFESQEGKEHYERELAAYLDGDMDDPWPDLTDDEVKELDDADYEQHGPLQGESRLLRRRRLKEDREAVRRYQVYKWAKKRDEADTDEDDYITAADSFKSEDQEMADILADPEKLAEFEAEMLEYLTGKKELPTDEDDRAKVIGQFAVYRQWQEAQESKRIAPERWPPRLPLGIAEPMAGGLHGFVSGHRHGDTCRVAVYHPLYAEVIGFEYRGDRRINASLSDVTAGMVVEHDGRLSWSGFVFRRTDQLEDEELDEEEPEPSGSGSSAGAVRGSSSSRTSSGV